MKRKKYIPIFIAAMSISLIAIGCVYNLISGKSLQDNFMSLFLLNLPFCIAIGFIDLGVVSLTGKVLKRHNEIWRIFIDVILTTVVCMFITGLLNYMLSNTFDFLKDTLPIIPWNWIVVLLIEVFFSHLREVEMKKDKAQYQFQLLKNQINPHFLFNSLNVLASLAYQDAEKTNLFAKKLSSVYRYLLNTYERPNVQLDEELAFVRTYLYLENIRFGNTLQVNIKTDTGSGSRLVIPASIQMLVENAIKHNVNTKASPLVINIFTQGDSIIVSNNLQPRNNVIKNSIGLDNLTKQYALYGKKVKIKRTDTDFIVGLQFIDT